MKIQYCIDAKILFWIIEKLVIQFSENFFNAWLEIAGRRSTEISTPSWNEVNTMRYRSFPNVALKYSFVENTSSSFIEYHYLENEEVPAFKYVCPYQHESAKRNIYTMTSYTPQSVAIQIRRNTHDVVEKKAYYGKLPISRVSNRHGIANYRAAKDISKDLVAISSENGGSNRYIFLRIFLFFVRHMCTKNKNDDTFKLVYFLL
ncbi:hypothetical protein BS614_20245 [Paenibacillus xylanexedens]|uniref:hypothetical protein n=1 Tax=Paenibacillus xylanexedens TaxID=528191 RepID=UPI000938372A|nr:hypothetical protein [Paenibacillus xylanexedens]APO46128.1 hypothetical protein BS614_20245 [Paenibacillus xylanexedens]